MNKYRTYFILLLAVFAVIGCEADERTSLNVAERKVVNARYKDALDSVNKMMIVECTERRDKRFKTLVDSLKTTRLKEIEHIIKAQK